MDSTTNYEMIVNQLKEISDNEIYKKTQWFLNELLRDKNSG